MDQADSEFQYLVPMPQSRSNQILLEATSTYHCISWCVRRQFLCALDPLTGRDDSHRRDWIRQRVSELHSVFAIDILACAVMSNLLHVVLRRRESGHPPSDCHLEICLSEKFPRWIEAMERSSPPDCAPCA